MFLNYQKGQKVLLGLALPHELTRTILFYLRILREGQDSQNSSPLETEKFSTFFEINWERRREGESWSATSLTLQPQPSSHLALRRSRPS